MRAEKAHRDMDDRVEAFEIEPSYNEDPFTRGPRVLWGRVAALGGGLILFFLIGHWTAGGGGSSQQVTTLQRQVDQDRTTIQQLQQSLAAVSQSPSTNPTAATTPGTRLCTACRSSMVMKSDTAPVMWRPPLWYSAQISFDPMD